MTKLKPLRYKNPDFLMKVEPELKEAYNPDRFEFATREIICKLIKRESIFIDVGGHYGFYSLLASTKITRGDIFSFEPAPKNAKIFQNNIRLNNFQRIKLYNYAVSNTKEEKDFYISGSSDSSGFTPHPRAGFKEKIKVKTIALDELFGDKAVDVVKVDTEGHELEVIKGMKKIISNNPKIKIVLEFNPKCLIGAGVHPWELFRAIKELGLETYMIKDSDPMLIELTNSSNDWNNYMDANLYANILCLRKDEIKILAEKSELIKTMVEKGVIEKSLNQRMIVSKLPRDVPLISIIIPSRIGENIKTLAYLSNQTYKNTEIIIEYDYKQEGVSVVRNRGARKAKGKYLFFCDNDLELEPDALENLYLTAKKTGAKWVFGKFWIEGEGMYNEGKNMAVPKNEKSVEFVEWFRGISTMSLIDASVKPVFDENFKKFNDWDLWLTIYKRGYEPVFCDKVLFRTSFKPGGISLSNDAEFWQDKLYIKHGVSNYDEALRSRTSLLSDYKKLLEDEKHLLEEKSKEFGDLIFRKDVEILRKNEEIRRKNEEIRRKNEEIRRKNEEIREYARIVQDREAQINAMVNSMRWKVPNYVYKLYKHRIKPFKPKHVVELFKRGSLILKEDGALALSRNIHDYILYGEGRLKGITKGEGLDFTDYECWIQANEKFDENETAQQIKCLNYKPVISIIFTVSNANEIFLRKAIFSIIYQYYKNWELCILDDGSTSPIIKKVLGDFQKRDSRIKVLFSEDKNNFSAKINKTAKISKGEFVSFINCEQSLSRNALLENVKLLNNKPDLELIYGDNDKFHEDGSRVDPNFKPDWSPELLLSYNYVGTFTVVRRKLFLALGGYRDNLAESEEYDFLLRLSEKTNKIGHVSKILYHQGILLGSKFDPNEPHLRERIMETGKFALRDSLNRRRIKGEILISKHTKSACPPVYEIKFSSELYKEKVTILIPTKDKVQLLSKCINSIKKKTNYKNYEVLVINNNSEEKRTFDFLKKEKVNYISIPTSKFNFARIHNLALKKVHTELVLFLNNDTEVISSDWLLNMVGTIHLDKNIGAVGAKLLYRDKRVQHAGIILGLSQLTASHANKMISCCDCGYQGYNLAMRNYSAVTAACMLTKKSLYEKVGGFDEENFSVAFNDVDYCLRLSAAGYRTVFNPNALLYHHECQSRKVLPDDMKEVNFFRNKWGKVIKKDPFYNINLSLDNERFEIKKNW